MQRGPVRIALFGMHSSIYTHTLLDLLLQIRPDSGIRLTHLVLPTQSAQHAFPLPVETQGSLRHRAMSMGVSCLEYPADDITGLLSQWRQNPVDLLVVACFPYRLPEALLCQARYGGWNLHPSCLPAHRGPDPLFWQLRHGYSRFVMTLHQMTSTLDDGPIYCQQEFTPHAEDYRQLEAHLARLAAACLSGTLKRLTQGMLERITPIMPVRESYQGLPTQRDCQAGSTLAAWQAWAFFKRALMYSGYVVLHTEGQQITLTGIHDFRLQLPTEPLLQAGGYLHIGMAQGSLVVKISDVSKQHETGMI